MSIKPDQAALDDGGQERDNLSAVMGGNGLLLEDLCARNTDAPDSRLDMKLFETVKKDLVGRLLPEMRKLIFGGREHLTASHVDSKGRVK
jgi:hypothetical protein